MVSLVEHDYFITSGSEVFKPMFKDVNCAYDFL